jgi:hypothetical protein
MNVMAEPRNVNRWPFFSQFQRSIIKTEEVSLFNQPQRSTLSILIKIREVGLFLADENVGSIFGNSLQNIMDWA